MSGSGRTWVIFDVMYKLFVIINQEGDSWRGRRLRYRFVRFGVIDGIILSGRGWEQVRRFESTDVGSMFFVPEFGSR